MAALQKHLEGYENLIRVPWTQSVSGPQRVWFGVYDPADERRLRLCLGDFENITRGCGYRWSCCDLTTTFAEWLGGQEYIDSYFGQPGDLLLPPPEYAEALAARVTEVLQQPQVDESSVVALYGIASLFGAARVSDLISSVSHHVRGRLLAFFPGEHTGSTYRLLGARDSWNYLAVPFTITFMGPHA